MLNSTVQRVSSLLVGALILSSSVYADTDIYNEEHPFKTPIQIEQECYSRDKRTLEYEVFCHMYGHPPYSMLISSKYGKPLLEGVKAQLIALGWKVKDTTNRHHERIWTISDPSN